MKNSLVIFTLILLSFGFRVMAGGDETSYVKTKDQVYIGQDVKMGLFNYRVICNDGTITKVRNRDVVAYSHNSQLFENLPVVCNDKDTACWAMMQFVTVRQGLNLYKYTNYTEKKPKTEYYVFKNGKFYLRIDQKNAKTVLPFFGIKVV